MNQRLHRRKGGVRRHDDFAVRLQSLREVEQIDDHRPGRAEDGVFGPGVSGEFGFERLAFLAQDILAGAQRAQGGLFNLRIHEALGE